MVIAGLERLTSKNYRLLTEVASQIAGRKQRRKRQFDFRVPRSMQRRARQSPFKDIAESHGKQQLISWIKEDGHAPNAEGGSLSDAVRHTIATLHHVHKRDLIQHRKGGSIDLIGDAKHYLKRTHSALENVAGTTLKQADILADEALDRIGVRKSRYGPLERTADNQLHARLAKEAYKSHGDRSSVDGWDYVDGNDKHAIYGQGNSRMVVYRGTRPDDKVVDSGDLSADLKVASGTGSQMYGLADDRRVINDLMDKGHDVSLSGYSLGGSKVLELMSDPELYKKLGNRSHVISPGVSPLDPHLKQKAQMDKVHFTLNAFDPVAQALVPHATDNHHHVENKYRDPLSAHTTFLDDLAKGPSK